jgi:hypothetical protein
MSPIPVADSPALGAGRLGLGSLSRLVLTLLTALPILLGS